MSKEQLAGLVEKWRATASDEIGMAYSGPWEACAAALAAQPGGSDNDR